MELESNFSFKQIQCRHVAMDKTLYTVVKNGEYKQQQAKSSW